MEEVEIFAGGRFVEGEQRLQLEVVEQAGGLAVGAASVDEGHGPIFKFAAGYGAVFEDIDVGVARVAGDRLEDHVHVAVVAFEHLEEGAGVEEQHAGEVVEGVARAGAVEEELEVVFGDRARRGAGVDDLLHALFIGGGGGRMIFGAYGMCDASNARMSYLKRADKEGRRFVNPVPTTVGSLRMALKLLPQYLRNREEREPKGQLGPFKTDARVYATAPASGLRVTWLGHSSMLIEMDGARVLVDPVWEERVSPVQWFGPKRFFAPPLKLEDLPAIDVVLVSHDHYDHLGAHTVRKLAGLKATAEAQWVTSLGVGRRLRRFGVAQGKIAELDWTESVVAAGLTITAWPARHFSGRGVLDRFTTLWSSFVLEGPRHRVYFGADSGMWDGFAEFAAKYDGFDLTMLEIGASHPLWKSIHMGPDGAVEAYAAMGGFAKAGLLMPIHWGLFNLALHGWRQPMERLLELGGIPLWSPEPGVPTEVWAGEEVRSDWWSANRL